MKAVGIIIPQRCVTQEMRRRPFPRPGHPSYPKGPVGVREEERRSALRALRLTRRVYSVLPTPLRYVAPYHATSKLMSPVGAVWSERSGAFYLLARPE